MKARANRIAYITDKLVVLLFVCTLLSLAADFLVWPLNLLAHFKWHYAVFSVVLGIVLLLYRKVFFALLALVIVAVNGVAVLPYYQEPLPLSGIGTYEDIKILQFNTMSDNKKRDEAIAWVESVASDYDIIVLQEVTQPWLRKINEMQSELPIFLERNSFGANKVVILSKLPLDRVEYKLLPESKHTAIMAGLKTRNENIPFALYAIHAVSPRTEERQKLNDTALKELSDALLRERLLEQKILVGDLNTTVFSSAYKKLEDNSGLRNTAYRMGYSGTWPSTFPAILGVPIDHTLISSGISVVDKKVLNNTHGSDHYPVVTTLRLYK